ncbi:His Kinase A (phospho-acceptor) domain-containing protein [Desulfotomaculum arcticum]|uniref:histidine kinase n=1 Tax=Desulfotruncus arcticus DSM 17038 TaxID=1121424 RepID=A0A1I2U4R4_9FIRM|nr:ATP-binding protein [Desulfotruncus arcticus]SFG72084.1 His Kinase A (phospho-acceptor) domain-containing protein [Desulfotomaculum arcticum] [Desulfotruncus arcticus DSM 17038]
MKANRAERLASLGTLAAGVAHEINQPLNSLKMMADSLLYWYSIDGTLDLSEVVEELSKISSQAERIGEIINRMRGFVRSENNAQIDHCDLNEAVEDALTMFGCQLSSHGIKVRKTLFHPIPLIMADKKKLEEVVINLTVNAMQALDTTSKPNKEVLIATYVEDNVILEISDNATGVDKNIAHKIFEPFFTTKEAGVGMGLGLSIAHSIVSSFEGRIYVKENHMGGATFRIKFPVAKP